MVAQGGVSPEHVEYSDLPWKYAAGTPNILGVIVSAQALRLLVDMVTECVPFFGTDRELPRAAVKQTMDAVRGHTRGLTARALEAVSAIDGLTVYGPADAADRAPLVSFTVAGTSPFALAEALDAYGVESRAGCHCATLAHRALELEPLASCRLSFYVYNTADDVDRATGALARIVASSTSSRNRYKVPSAPRVARR